MSHETVAGELTRPAGVGSIASAAAVRGTGAGGRTGTDTRGEPRWIVSPPSHLRGSLNNDGQISHAGLFAGRGRRSTREAADRIFRSRLAGSEFSRSKLLPSAVADCSKMCVGVRANLTDGTCQERVIVWKGGY